MANILIMAPAPIASVTATRGHDAVLLLTRDPKEVWTDGAAGGSTELRIDLGAARAIDTVFLGALYRAAGAATWSITAGVAADDEMTVAASAALRAPEAAGRVSAVSHALWHGDAFTARYITITVSQPAGSLPLQAGSMMVGAAFVPTWNKEWGSGRLHGELKARSVETLRRSAERGKISGHSPGTGFGGHFRAVQGFRYLLDEGAP